MARAWTLASRPFGMTARDNFALVEQELPAVGPGEVRVRNHFLSVEPAMRALMNDVEGYRAALQIGAPISGRAVGVVEESRADGLAVGDTVFHYLGWRDEAVGPASAFEKLPVEDWIPEEYWLASLGMAGATSYFGLIDVTNPKAGETLFVSAAAGSVGSNVVQIGKALGMRVIGSAGGAEKCALLKDLGADAVIDYKAPGTMIEKLRAAAPEGVDVYFDNVGGDHLDAALANSRPNARFSLCGMIATYNYEDARQPDTFGHMMRIVASRIMLKGFVIDDYEKRIPEFRAQMREWVREKKVKPLITFSEGLESTPDAFVGLFSGRNTGKILVRL